MVHVLQMQIRVSIEHISLGFDFRLIPGCVAISFSFLVTRSRENALFLVKVMQLNNNPTGTGLMVTAPQ